MVKVRECPIAPYNPKRNFDMLFEIIVKKSHKACLQKDKSATWLCAGDVGSGKSTLMFWAMELVEETPTVDRIGFNTQTFAKAMSLCEGKKAPFVAHDEFNLNSRNSMTEGNKDFIDLLFSVRGENWLLWANNPSVQSIDKQILLEGLVNFIIFVHKEQERYLLFTRQGLLQLIKDHGSASFYNLKTHGVAYAVYDGWFKAYKGDLWKEYSVIKKERMREKVDTYVRKYSHGNLISFNMAANKLSCSWSTVRKAFNYGCKEKALIEDKHYITIGTNKPKFTKAGFEEIKDIVQNQTYLGDKDDA